MSIANALTFALALIKGEERSQRGKTYRLDVGIQMGISKRIISARKHIMIPTENFSAWNLAVDIFKCQIQCDRDKFLGRR